MYVSDTCVCVTLQVPLGSLFCRFCHLARVDFGDDTTSRLLETPALFDCDEPFGHSCVPLTSLVHDDLFVHLPARRSNGVVGPAAAATSSVACERDVAVFVRPTSKALFTATQVVETLQVSPC